MMYMSCMNVPYVCISLCIKDASYLVHVLRHLNGDGFQRDLQARWPSLAFGQLIIILSHLVSLYTFSTELFNWYLLAMPAGPKCADVERLKKLQNVFPSSSCK